MNLCLKEITDRNVWDNLLTEFGDANIYQTWNFSSIVYSEKREKHLAFFKNGEVIGIALARIKIIPVINRGIIYIFRGPLWQKKDGITEYNVLYEIFSALKNEYVTKKKLLLRIRPFMFTESGSENPLNSVTGFKINKRITPYRSILLDLNDSLENIRASFRRTWRQDLKKSEKCGTEVISGYDENLFEVFISVYRQMHKRKKFDEYVDVMKLLEVTKKLNSDFRSKIFIAYQGDTPIAVFMGSSIGKTGIALSGGANEMGRNHQASYLLQWEMIKWLKSKGCYNYDVGGINPEINPAGYVFKIGISKNEIQEVGVFEACESNLSKFLVSLGEYLRSILRFNFIKQTNKILHLIFIKLMTLAQLLMEIEHYGIKPECY